MTISCRWTEPGPVRSLVCEGGGDLMWLEPNPTPHQDHPRPLTETCYPGRRWSNQAYVLWFRTDGVSRWAVKSLWESQQYQISVLTTWHTHEIYHFLYNFFSEPSGLSSGVSSVFKSSQNFCRCLWEIQPVPCPRVVYLTRGCPRQNHGGRREGS